MIDLKEKVHAIAKKYQPEKIILFGSYAIGRQTSDSDVDLLIILDTNQSLLDLSVEISSMLKHNIPIDILVRTPQQIAKRIELGDFFLKDIIENGKILYERNN